MSNESFRWITNGPAPYITVDALKRLYLSSGCASELGLKPPLPLFVGYDAVNKRLIVAKPNVVKAVNVRPFMFDKRRYASARAFIRTLQIADADLPQRYEYIGRDYSEYPQGSHVFQLSDFAAPDAGVFDGDAE